MPAQQRRGVTLRAFTNLAMAELLLTGSVVAHAQIPSAPAAPAATTDKISITAQRARLYVLQPLE